MAATRTWEDEALATRQGGRGRRAVVELLARQSCCVTAQEIFDLLRAGGGAVGLATVYRTVDQLSKDGFLQRIELGDGITRYEPADRSGHHHHHVVCGNCGKVDAFEDDRLEQALRRVEQRTGYAVDAHDVVLRGTCRDCC